MDPPNTTADSEDVLDQALSQTWAAICAQYDVKESEPSLTSLLEGSDVSSPLQAAQTVIMNMLIEMIACVDRFSPWYSKPAAAFGLEHTRQQASGRHCWKLTSEAKTLWSPHIADLTHAIGERMGVIQATLLVADLFAEVEEEGDQCLLAVCHCPSPRVIRVYRSVLEKNPIICDACNAPFTA